MHISAGLPALHRAAAVHVPLLLVRRSLVQTSALFGFVHPLDSLLTPPTGLSRSFCFCSLLLHFVGSFPFLLLSPPFLLFRFFR